MSNLSEEQLRNIAKEEMKKAIKINLDSALIFAYVQSLEKENKELKQILEERLGYFYE